MVVINPMFEPNFFTRQINPSFWKRILKEKSRYHYQCFSSTLVLADKIENEMWVYGPYQNLLLLYRKKKEFDNYITFKSMNFVSVFLS